MLNKNMEKALNEQINKEMYSAFLYMAMSAYAEQKGLRGIAHWFMVQYHEEMLHGMKIYEYIQSQGNVVALAALAKPDANFTSALDLFEKALAHEQYITKSIYSLVDAAIADRDHASKTFLDWYVTEQVEEEDNVNMIIQTLSMIGDNTAALYLYDKELAVRMVTIPTDFSVGVTKALAAGA